MAAAPPAIDLLLPIPLPVNHSLSSSPQHCNGLFIDDNYYLCLMSSPSPQFNIPNRRPIACRYIFIEICNVDLA